MRRRFPVMMKTAMIAQHQAAQTHARMAANASMVTMPSLVSAPPAWVVTGARICAQSKSSWLFRVVGYAQHTVWVD